MIQTENVRQITTGNGVTIAFPLTVEGYASDYSDLAVYRYDSTVGGNPVLLTDGVDYGFAGALLLMSTAPTATQKIIIMLNKAGTQDTNYVENDTFPAATHEANMDKVVVLTNQLKDMLSRAPLAPVNLSNVGLVGQPLEGGALFFVGGRWATVDVSVEVGGSLVSPRVYGDMVNGDGTAYAEYNSSNTRTTINRHAFEDHNVLNTVDTGLGYASFDAQPVLTNGLDQDHLVGFQSRPIYKGSANLTGYLDGFNSAPVHKGLGIVGVHRGVRVTDIGGAGPVQSSYGLYIDTISRGSVNNYSIYLNAASTAPCYLGTARVIMDNSTVATNRLSGAFVMAGWLGALGVWADTIKADTLIQSSGVIIAGTTTADNAYYLRSSAGYRRYFAWQTGGLHRWLAECGNATESGANAGSPWLLSAYDDAGTFIDTPISILRASGGAMTLGGSTKRHVVQTGQPQYTAKALTANGSTTSFTYPANTRYQYVTTSAASLATTLPATSAALDGMVITLVLSAAVGTTTWVAGSGGATIVGGPASMSANTPVRFIYHHATAQWLPY